MLEAIFIENKLNNDIFQTNKEITNLNECTATVGWQQTPANQPAIAGHMAYIFVEIGSLPNNGASRGHFGGVS